MNPPKPYVYDLKRGWSKCFACENWTHSNSIFFHEGRSWVLCVSDYVDYWENTDELLPDYEGYVI